MIIHSFIIFSCTGTSKELPRQQKNKITSYLDANMVYGSNKDTCDHLREMRGGRMRISDDMMPPVSIIVGNCLTYDKFFN